MKIVYSTVLPFKGFLAINLFGRVFVRRELAYKFGAVTLNHEAIHTAQMKELWFVGFYIIYFFEWLYRLVFHTRTAYKGISFEREAYANEGNLEYLTTRRRFAQWKRKAGS